ncbi:hypothetical protein [Halorussus sp. AFM4]|uniref:hypothetical protein n=1 Tax=Halorussus sp. AFM4 TaxID=3421651 RepID=UPI003EBE610A
MTEKNLYTLIVPSDAQTLTRNQIQRNTATQGLLNEGTASVQSLSLDPDQKLLRGQYRGKYSELMAEEFEELFSSDVEQVPFFAVSSQSKDDGYYTLANVDIEPVDPRTSHVHSFDGVLTKAGTRSTHHRSVATTVRQVENDMGNTQTALVGVDAGATNVRWYDNESEQTEAVSVVETRTGEKGSVDVVDALASSYDNPTLVYDLPYSDEGKVDVVVWDDHGRSKLDSDGVNSWQWVFATSHEFAGSAIVDNGLVRVQLDSGLSVTQWDSSISSWSAVSLGSSNWELDDWSLTRIGPGRVEARTRFRDPSTSPTSYFELDMRLPRGWTLPQWVVAENEQGPTPSGLQDLLSPVADGQDYAAEASQGLVTREEVSK